MKNFNKIILVALAFVSMMSCKVDDFLEQKNENALSPDSFWKTQGDANAALFSVYSNLQNAGVYAGTQQMDNMTDLGYANFWQSNDLELMRYAFNEANPSFVGMWEGNYTGVRRANFFLEGIDAALGVPDADKVIMKAEARFLRAVFYYHLYMDFNNGSIPLYTENPVSEESFNQPLKSEEEVFSFLEKEFTEVKDILPTKSQWPTEFKGRATRGAAATFLATLYLNKKDYASAERVYSEVINSGEYALVDDYADNFSDDPNKEHNSESIFELNYQGELTPAGNQFNRNEGSNATEGNTRIITFTGQQSGGFRSTVVSPTLMTMIRNERDRINPNFGPANDLKARYISSVNENEPNLQVRTDLYSYRSMMSFELPEDNVPYYQWFGEDQDKKDIGIHRNATWALSKKMTPWDKGQAYNVGAYPGSNHNERIWRLADVYLCWAEAKLQVDPGAIDEVAARVNQIRARAGVDELRPEERATPEALMNHIMFVEKPLETSFEGRRRRFYDLRRWGQIKPYLIDDVSGRFIATAFEGGKGSILLRTLTSAEVAQWKSSGEETIMLNINDKDYNVKPLITTKLLAQVAYSEEDNYFPIPAKEVQRNGGIN